MKKYLILLLSILPILAQAQTIRIANNNPGAAGGTNVYTGTNALENALAAADPGDIIYVVPSAAAYGDNDINITQAVTIFGVGIRPDKDIGNKSVIDVNCFNCAIELNASNVRLSGLIIDGDINLNWDDSQNQSDIIIENCRVERILMNSVATFQISNLLIRNNVLTGNGSLATHILLRTTANTIVTNNIFTEGNIGSPMLETVGVIYTYNVFADLGNEVMFGNMTNNLFDHNLFYGVRVDAGNLNGNTFNYNLSFGAFQDSYHVFDVTTNGNTGTGNLESVAGSFDPLFTNFPLTQSWNDSYDLTLLPGSAALNINGEDIGPSGGATPFDPEGNLLPLIQSVTIPSVIPVGSDLPVNIKAKGN